MVFLTFLKTVDELVYELMSWLVFYPLTLWRSLTRPLTMMAYADAELGDDDKGRYAEALSPPLFLLVSLLLAHGIELALVGQSEVVRSSRGLAGLIRDDGSLILFRLLLFSAIPMIMATLLVRGRGEPVTRETLRPPFYSQCYAVGPLALGLGLGTALTYQAAAPLHWAGRLLILASLLFLLVTEIRWFAGTGPSGWGRAAARALGGLLLSFLLLALVALLVR